MNALANQMQNTLGVRGGENEMVSIEELIEVVKSKQPGALLEKYQPALSKCPMCNTDRRMVKGKPVLPKQLCKDECIKKTLKDMLYRDDRLAVSLLVPIALKRGLGNGMTLKFDWDGYRNNGLYFWDAKNKEIVPPFTEADDYGSVPPRFVVGDGYFNPTDWLNKVDHNTFVFPSRTLIKEIKAFFDLYPNDDKMIVKINGTEYKVINTKKLNGDELDSIILEFNRDSSLYIHRGNPEWPDSSIEKLIDKEREASGQEFAIGYEKMTGQSARPGTGPANLIKKFAGINSPRGYKNNRHGGSRKKSRAAAKKRGTRRFLSNRKGTRR